jgi:hypothetical protein
MIGGWMGACRQTSHRNLPRILLSFSLGRSIADITSDILAVMQEISPSKKIYTKESAVVGAGRGVFAATSIQKDEVIEVCPVIEISAHDMAVLGESILVTYFLFHGTDKEYVWLMLGFGSLYNHAYQANARYVIHAQEKSVEFIATVDIEKDTEITFDYTSGNLANKNSLWFEVVSPS